MKRYGKVPGSTEEFRGYTGSLRELNLQHKDGKKAETSTPGREHRMCRDKGLPESSAEDRSKHRISDDMHIICLFFCSFMVETPECQDMK